MEDDNKEEIETSNEEIIESVEDNHFPEKTKPIGANIPPEENTNKEQDKNKKLLPYLLIVIIFLIMIVCAGFTIKMNGEIETTKDKKEESFPTPTISPSPSNGSEPEIDDEEDNEARVEVTDENTKEKLKYFIDTCSNWMHLSIFRAGKVGLSQELKLGIATMAAYNNTSIITKHPLPKEIQEELEIDTGERPFYRVSLDDFDKTYKELFNEEPNYDKDSIQEANACPFPLTIDDKTNSLYLSNSCGKTSSTETMSTVLSYEETSKYYYVTVKLVDTNIETNELAKTEKLVWKFDKEYRFKSTKKVEGDFYS